MESLTDKEKRILKKAGLYIKEDKVNPLSIAEDLLEIESRIEKFEELIETKIKEIKDSAPDLAKIFENARGKDGMNGKDGKDGKNGKNGKNGKDGRDGKDGEKGDKGDKGDNGKDGLDGKDGSPDTPEQIIEKINIASNKINKEKIEGLNDLLLQMQERIASRGGARKIPIIRTQFFTGDDSTTQFSLPRDTVRVLGVWSTQYPVVYNPTSDYSFSGNTLTLNFTMQTNQTIMVMYETLFYA